MASNVCLGKKRFYPQSIVQAYFLLPFLHQFNLLTRTQPGACSVIPDMMTKCFSRNKIYIKNLHAPSKHSVKSKLVSWCSCVEIKWCLFWALDQGELTYRILLDHTVGKTWQKLIMLKCFQTCWKIYNFQILVRKLMQFKRLRLERLIPTCWSAELQIQGSWLV